MSDPALCLVCHRVAASGNKVLLPGATTLVRLVSEIRERANQRLWKKLAALPDSWQTARVTELLDIPEGSVLHRWSN
jgi:hypothetical protein